MNIILLIIDTLRYDYVGANGNAWIHTPNLDAFAAGAWRFDRAFCASFPTIPYRNDAITGRYGAPFHVWKPLPFDARTIPWTLAEAGYATQLIHDTPHLVNGGHNFDWPFHAWTFVRGAEVDRPWLTDTVAWPDNWRRDPRFESLGEEALHTRQINTYARANRDRRSAHDWNCARLFGTAARFLRENAGRDRFFLWVDCFDPHEPWDTPVDFMTRYDPTPGCDGRVDPRSLFAHRNEPGLSDEAKAHIKAQYAAKVTWMDHCLGRFLEGLDATGLAGNTAVILAGDHGTNVGERGRFGKGLPVREQEGHIPLFIRLPDGDTGRCPALAQPQDLFATVMGLAGLPAPSDLDGRDLVAFAREGRGEARRIALAGGAAHRWRITDEAGRPAVLFSAFTPEWALEVAAKPEHTRLSRLGSLDYVERDHPKVVEELHAVALDELERRGADPALMDWIRRGAGDPPEECRFWDGWPGPPGFRPYFQRGYTGP